VRQYGANIVVLPKGADVPLEVAGADLSRMVDAGSLPLSTVDGLHSFRWRNNILGVAPQAYAAGAIGAVRVPVVGTWFTHGGDGMKAIAPWWKVDGSLPGEDAAEALVGRALAKRLALTNGSDFALNVGGSSRTLKVAGVLDAGGLEDDQLYVPLAWLQQATGRAGEVDRVLVSALVLPGDAPPMPDPAKDLKAYEQWTCRPYAASISHEIEYANHDVSARPVAALVHGEGRLVSRLNLLMLLLTGAALAAAVLGVMSTMVASVVDRTQEIALLRALGATRNAVGRLFLAEALVVALVGGTLGVGIGFALAQVIGRGTFGTAVEPHPLLLPAGLVLAAFVCLAGAWLPVRRTAAIDPAIALKAGA
jgi:putative ABC transport system permease protein